MSDLSRLTDEQLVKVYAQGEKLSRAANITVPWMNIPDTDEWNQFVKLTNLKFWRDHVIKPIDAINIFKDIKDEAASRWIKIAQTTAKTDTIRIA